MRRKSSNFLERYTDKFILGIFAIACIWLLVFQVLSGGSSVTYDSKKFGPSRIDNYIEAQARDLEEKLNMEPDTQREYESKLDTYKSLLSSAINSVDSRSFLLLPNYGTKTAHGDRVYQIPQIGQLDDVAAQLVRGVAYNPLYDEPEMDSLKPEDEMIDVDLITVQGLFEAAGLFERFFENFAGKGLVEQWRDKEFARPIFAAVQLNRQQMTKDGNWPEEWERVARPKVDPLKDTLKVPENVSELQFGVEILMVQFDKPDIRIGLLQPEIYEFALPTDSWLPPTLYQQRQERIEKLQQEEERSVKEAEKRQRKEDRGRTGERRERDRQTQDVGMTRSRGGDGMGGGPVGGARDRRTTTRRTTRRESERPTRTTTEDFERTRGRPGRVEIQEIGKDEIEQFEEIKLTESTDFKEMTEALVFWDHDDTAEPGYTYRYRMRIGVFNPIAGTEWFSNESQQFKGQVILWSDYSPTTEAVTVPKKMYFFPVQIRESDKALTVDVKKYSLGKWYDHNFIVKPGESIGQIVKLPKTDESEEFGPSSIDYQTGAVLLDVANVSDWFGPTTLRRRDYSDVLYTLDGVSIEHLPVQARYWPSEFRKKLDEINKKQAEQEKEPLTLRSRRTIGPRAPQGGRRMPGRPTPGMPGRPF